MVTTNTQKEPLVDPALNTAGQGSWTTGLANTPVFIDGLSSTLSYLIVACKNSSDTYSVVCIGKWGTDEFKIKFYGSFEEWGFNESSLLDKFRATNFRSYKGQSQGYERYWTDREGVRRIIKALGETRNVTVAPYNGVLDAFELPYDVRSWVSQIAHPKRGGHRPALPFSALPLLVRPASVPADADADAAA